MLTFYDFARHGKDLRVTESHWIKSDSSKKNSGLQKYEAGNIYLKDELFQKQKVGFSNQQLFQKHIFLVQKTDFVVSKE